MNPCVDLIWFGKEAPLWDKGEVWTAELNLAAVRALVEKRLPESTAPAWLFWDGALGMPDPRTVDEALQRPGELWHAGLRLGMQGLPNLLDAISPNWMLARDPDAHVEATSWRLSLRACLLNKEVLRQMGNFRADYRTLEGAALEWGHRCVTHGVFTRHLPWLVRAGVTAAVSPLPLEDELRFVFHRFGRFWSRWALLRSVMTRQVSADEARRAWQVVGSESTPAQPPRYVHATPAPEAISAARVSVIIPTVDRYPFLRTLLDQIRHQTVPPREVIVIDQTAREYRETRLAEEFCDLPLRILYQDEAGQCASRNAGLQTARGDYILFIDDDDEIKPTLIEEHLKNLNRFRADVSSGVADEHGAGPLPDAFTFTRTSDVFPTNNTLVRREVLERSGLFDLAYNRGQRADGDLGMRVYLSGALMVLNPDISVIHHHAPSGGLRLHKARVITYASSRHRLTHRQLLSATEIYLAGRYYSPRQLKELLWLSVLGTFSIRGTRWRKVLKVLISLTCLPHTLWEMRKRQAAARTMLRNFPQIPTLIGPGSRVEQPSQMSADLVFNKESQV